MYRFRACVTQGAGHARTWHTVEASTLREARRLALAAHRKARMLDRCYPHTWVTFERDGRMVLRASQAEPITD